jgi:lipoate-protein ligase A
MALDEVLFRGCQEGGSPIFRLYGWDPPGLSLGRHQKSLDGIDLTFCRRAGISVVRRLTGGRSVLHHREITYSVISRYEDPFPRTGVVDTYMVIARGLAAGLRQLGVATVIAGRGDRSRRRSPDCFKTVSLRELTWKGRKLVGSAQLRERDGFLQHGSIPISVEESVWSGVFPGRGTEVDGGVGLEEIMGCSPGRESVEEALREGFKNSLEIDLVECGLTAEEEEKARRLAELKYSTISW